MPAIVLSASRQESAKFIAQEGLGSAARHVVSKDTLPYPNSVSDIHILPSYRDRRDYHAVESALRHLKRKAHDVREFKWVRTPDGDFVRADVPRQADPIEDAPDPASIEDTSKDAVPGQLSIETVTPAEVQAAQLDALKSIAPADLTGPEQQALEAYLEPGGFELSDDPDVQVEQILKSAAGIPNEPVADPAPKFPWDES